MSCILGLYCLSKAVFFNEWNRAGNAYLDPELIDAVLTPAAAPKLSPSMVKSPSVEIQSMPNNEKGTHLNWSALQNLCLQKEEQTLFLHGMFSLRI